MDVPKIGQWKGLKEEMWTVMKVDGSSEVNGLYERKRCEFEVKSLEKKWAVGNRNVRKWAVLQLN